ncbi:MAG: sel1 repeat family protein [Gammaproteobacteria bacterium]|nr:sel1 repeat family protein [Gammaproteobacteria bacterium]
MLNRFVLPLIILSLASSTILAGELDDGFKAFTAGNYEQALRLWLPLAEKDDDKAQYNLGILYQKGLGVEKNIKTAFIWYKRASANGNTDAMYNLGIMYDHGKVIYRSPKDATRWWKQAAELGNEFAQFNIAVEYAYGRMLGKDVDKAIMWWKKSAAQGNKDSRAALYKTYSEGLFGITANPQEAKRWK